MNKNNLFFALRKFVIILLMSCSAAYAQDTVVVKDVPNEKLYVQIKSTKLRKEPKQWGLAIADLQYGDTLKLVVKEGDWLKVSKQGADTTEVQGYVHQSAISGRRILLAATADAILNTSPAETDVFLAGKGFSSGVVEQFLKSSDSVVSQDLTSMKGKENFEEADFEQFVKSGNLKNA